MCKLKKAGYKGLFDRTIKEELDKRVAAKLDELQKNYQTHAAEAFQALEESMKNCHKKVILPHE